MLNEVYVRDCPMYFNKHTLQLHNSIVLKKIMTGIAESVRLQVAQHQLIFLWIQRGISAIGRAALFKFC